MKDFNIMKNSTNTDRRSQAASPKQLIGLLRIRLKDQRSLVGRINGIERRLKELRMRPPCRLSWLPDWEEVEHAINETLGDYGQVASPRPDHGDRRRGRRRNGNGRAIATRAIATTTTTHDDALPPEVIKLLRRGKKIEAISRYRAITRVGLEAAMEAIKNGGGNGRRRLQDRASV
jgi:hypothetical protein